MTSVCLYFKVHQPYRLKKYLTGDIDVSHCYEDAIADEAAINRISDQCYLPVNTIMADLIAKNKNGFKINFSFSGVVLELMERYRPDVLRSFQRLVATGNVEILGETCYHSLSSLHSKTEFEEQVRKHKDMIRSVFKKEPVVFRNTELIYNNKLSRQVADMGFKGLLCEGVEKILKGRSVNKIYEAPCLNDFGLLLRNARLSDDIAFRFDDGNWQEHPLTAEKFGQWLHSHPADTSVINLFMDYETFGSHKKKSSGIFDFLKALPAAVLENRNFVFSTASEALDLHLPNDIYDVSQTISWEDQPAATCVWSENVMQHNTLGKIYSLEKMVKQSGCENFLSTWRRLQSADHFYYMSCLEDKDASHKYQNPFATAEDAFRNYNNIITDFEISLIRHGLQTVKKQSSWRSVAASLF
jgi:alpha-amylase